MISTNDDSSIDLTIIIPVYNALPYLYKCIESITTQNLGSYSLEVILVDDGSTDGSGEYCDEMAQQWNYIRAIHRNRPSGTPSCPRNIGIKEARGHYIFFCDNDDYFEKNALVDMLDHAYEDKCDVGLFKVSGEGRTTPKIFESDTSYRHCKISDCTISSPKFFLSFAPWKLFDRDLIETHDIKFPEGVGYEDLPFTLECYFNASNICIYNDQIYYHLISRDDGANLSLQASSNSCSWGNVQKYLSGIENYLMVASQYCTPDNCPLAYRRGFIWPIRHLLAMVKDADEEIRQKAFMKIREYFLPCSAANPFREILSLRDLILLDALYLCNDQTFIDLSNAWPNGASIGFSTLEDGTLEYTIYSDKDEHALFHAPFPLNANLEGQPLQKPTLFKNRVTSLQATSEALDIAGHVQALRHCEQGEFSAKLRLYYFEGKYDRWLESITLSNVKSSCAYASVYQIEFDWNTHCKYEDLIPDDTFAKDRVNFFLDVEFDTGDVVSNRFGENRFEGILDDFVSKPVWHNGYLFGPCETKFKKISCGIYSETQLIKSSSVKFLKHSDQWFLEVNGATNFDNYASTQIELAILDKDGNDVLCLPLEKSTDTKDKKFKGSFKLDDLDDASRKAMANFELRLDIAGKTYCSQVTNVKATPTFANRIAQLQTTSEAIEISGHVQLVSQSDQGKFKTKLRAHFNDGEYDREFDNVLVENLETTYIYGTTYATEFDWCGYYPFEDLIPTDNVDPSRIYFYLDAEFENGDTESNRFGHDRAEEIYPNFISQAVWCSDYLFVPYETKYKNLSLYAYSNVQLVRATSLKFSKRDSSWYLNVQGELNFDNYASTQIELAILDKDGNDVLCLPLEKSTDTKDKKFKGSFKLDDLDKMLKKGVYTFELRVGVTNKTFCYQDLKIARSGKTSIERNGKEDLLYTTNENDLFFETQQRIPLRRRISKK